VEIEQKTHVNKDLRMLTVNVLSLQPGQKDQSFSALILAVTATGIMPMDLLITHISIRRKTPINNKSYLTSPPLIKSSTRKDKV
jgi:hypothetical protein